MPPKTSKQMLAEITPSMVVCGLNTNNQLSDSDKISTQDKVFPPFQVPIDVNDFLSYSVYYSHSVTITKQGAFSIGPNTGNINHKSEKNGPKLAQLTFEDENRSKYSILSSVCGAGYTLHLIQNNSGRSFLLFCQDAVSNSPFFIQTGNYEPICLFGGRKTSAAVDSYGNIILIAQNVISSKEHEAQIVTLPNNEKAIQIACLERTFYALSNEGKIYFLTNNYQGKKMSKYNCYLADEVANEFFVEISGTFSHVLALTSDGRIFGQGSNMYGNFGIENKKNYLKFEEFSHLKKLGIVSFSAGNNHSLFIDSKGAVYACGTNANHELPILSDIKIKGQISTKLLPTVVKKGATFCIAGYQLSCIFIDVDIPPNMPNQKVKKFIKLNTNEDVIFTKSTTKGKINNKKLNQINQLRSQIVALKNKIVDNNQKIIMFQQENFYMNQEIKEITNLFLQNMPSGDKRLLTNNNNLVNDDNSVIQQNNQAKMSKQKTQIADLAESDDEEDEGEISNNPIFFAQKSKQTKGQPINKIEVDDEDEEILPQTSSNTVSSKGQRSNPTKSSKSSKQNVKTILLEYEDDDEDDEEEIPPQNSIRNASLKIQKPNQKKGQKSNIIELEEDEEILPQNPPKQASTKTQSINSKKQKGKINDIGFNNDDEIIPQKQIKKTSSKAQKSIQRKDQANKKQRSNISDLDDDEEEELDLSTNPMFRPQKTSQKEKQANKKEKSDSIEYDDDDDDGEDDSNNPMFRPQRPTQKKSQVNKKKNTVPVEYDSDDDDDEDASNNPMFRPQRPTQKKSQVNKKKNTVPVEYDSDDDDDDNVSNNPIFRPQKTSQKKSQVSKKKNTAPIEYNDDDDDDDEDGTSNNPMFRPQKTSQKKSQTNKMETPDPVEYDSDDDDDDNVSNNPIFRPQKTSQKKSQANKKENTVPVEYDSDDDDDD